jgi:hypothetical protein
VIAFVNLLFNNHWVNFLWNLTRTAFMKNFMAFGILVGALISSTGALASTHVEYQHQDVLNGIPLDNVCVTATQIQTLRPLKVCLEKKEVRAVNDGLKSADFVCVKWTSKVLTYPRKNLPNPLSIRTWTENGEQNNYPGVQSEFTFPDCAEGN